jgi:excinuclease ABC subunit A
MNRNKAAFEISGITENNLKNIDFSVEIGEVVVIAGVSGSGKSTLVNRVVAAEAKRQSMMRRKSDDLFYYTVRPDFKRATCLPEAVIISQRAVFQSASSTFGTRTGLNALLVNLFVRRGEIHYQGEQINKPDIATVLKFRQQYYPKASLFGRIAQFENISRSQVVALLQSIGAERMLMRNEGKLSIKPLALDRLPTKNLNGYEIFIDLDKVNNPDRVLKNTRAVPVLIDIDLELDFHEHGVSLKDGTIFRLPSKLLFSHSTMSSRSGCCLECGGTGEVTTYDSQKAIDKKAIIKNGFLSVPLTASGRYKGFKFLPSGLANLLKKEGVDVSKSFSAINATQQGVILEILNAKLTSNKNDPVAQQFLTTVPCQVCEGSGLSWQARAVTINGKSIDFFLGLTADELNSELSALSFDDDSIDKALTILDYISNLSVDHVALNRPVTTMSSGELQRMKLLPALVNQYSGKIIILDEPSSNLQYRDNLKVLRLINELKVRNNCIIIVDHNPVYQMIADRQLKIGPSAGVNGGDYCPADDYFQVGNLFDALLKSNRIAKKYSFKTIPLIPKRNVHLDSVRIPKKAFTAVIGSSGSGKSTLCRELIFPALSESDGAIFFDSKHSNGSSRSIVATYLNVFDKVRRLYARSAETGLTESDFSFNSTGACYNCQGSGYVDSHVCGVCFGSRFSSEVDLFKVEGKSITELLATDLEQIPFDGGLAFLEEAVQILQRLSLSHITLGRETDSLSGGELQRLKLARFMLASHAALDNKNRYIILDEPCSGLDPEAVASLYQVLQDYLSDSTVLVIEHNPYFIYRCPYLIDLGAASGIKDKNSVFQGFFGEKAFPSLNHAQVMEESLLLKDLARTPMKRTDIIIDDDDTPRDINGKRYDLIYPFFIKQKNFALEDKFSKSYQPHVPDDNVFFYQTKDALEIALHKESEFFFNPFINLLERYPLVPSTLKEKVIKGINRKSIVCDSDPWSFKVAADSFDAAYVKGGGVVIVRRENSLYAYHGVRLLSIRKRVVDKIFPHKFAFNLYKNACDCCHGYGHIRSYPLTDWIKNSRSVLDDGFMPYPLNTVMPKNTIKRFAKEGLFDFSKPVSKLSAQELNILLYGFKAYKFRRVGKSDDAESSFYEWRGINSYLYRNAAKLSPDKDLNSFLEWRTCPFCSHGFSEKIHFYVVGERTFFDFML